MTRLRVFICAANETWPSMPAKLRRVQELFGEKVQFTFITQVFGFPTILFKTYGEGRDREVDRDFLKEEVLTKVPFDAPYDLVVFVVPKRYWQSGYAGTRGFTDLGISYITVGSMEENDVAQFGPATHPRLQENSFVHFLFHELSHYFPYLTYGANLSVCGYDSMEDCQDRTHYYIGQGKLNELVEWLPLPTPRTSEEERAFWLVYVLNFIKRVFLKEKIEVPEIEATIAEDIFYTPTQTPAKGSRIEELAFSMELVETNDQNPSSLGVRLNNPGCLKFSNWQKEYGAVRHSSNFARFPTYSAGKTGQLRLLRSAMTGRMPSYDPKGSIEKFIRAYANSSPEIEKQNYVRRVCKDLEISPLTTLKTLL